MEREDVRGNTPLFDKSNDTNCSFFLSPKNDDRMKIKNVDNFNLLLTNARSLAPKIDSLHNHFVELNVDIALVTESWLADGEVLDRDIVDLENAMNLKIIYKNRPKARNSMRSVGGGVSIIFDKTKCSLRERKIAGNKFELVLATGRIGKMARQIAVFCVYLPPKMSNNDLGQLTELVDEQILALKTLLKDPMIVLGGLPNGEQRPQLSSRRPHAPPPWPNAGTSAAPPSSPK